MATFRRRRTTVVALVVSVHLFVNALHGVVHWAIPVELTSFQLAYIVAVMGCAPVAALWSARRRRHATAGVILTASMAGSLVFGVAFHFVLATPDHVHAVPAGPWHVHFAWTAVVSALADAVGVGVGVWVVRA